MAKLVFKDGIDYSRVRVHKGSYFWFNLQTSRTAVTPNGEMYFLADDYEEDFSLVGEDLIYKRSWFLHEMTHVWQFQMGYAVRWHGILIRFHWGNAYKYTIEPGQVFGDFNMEQQGDIVGDYYAIAVAKTLKAAIHPPPFPTANELRKVLAPLFKDPKDAANLPK
jgi:hypothetical protein